MRLGIVLPGAGALLMVFLIGSFVHPFGVVKAPPGAPLFTGAAIDSVTGARMQQACANCHSDRVDWPWYSYVAPTSWLVESDVSRARSKMNLSRWDSYSSDQQSTLLSAIGSVMRTGQMPPKQYLLMHPEARLSETDREQIYQWTKAERRRIRLQQRSLEQSSWKK